MAGIWIRSQDKRCLEYCDAFRVVTPIDEFITPVEEQNKYIIKAYSTTLGIYSSKEKAMKVMNDIQEVISSYKIWLDTANSICTKITYIDNKDTKVFQMPEDEDVIIEEK